MDTDEKSSDDEIVKVEEILNVKLPKEYVEFLLNFGGGYFAFSNVFSGQSDSEWYVVLQNERAQINTNFVAVSDNGAGDYYGFKVVGGICESKVYIYDHEQKSINVTKYANLYEYLVGVGLHMM